MPELDPTFTDYVTARRPALVRMAFLLCGDVHLAEDLVQVALTKAVGRWRKISDNPEPWLRTVMVRDHVSWWRRHRGREHLTDVVPDSAHDVAPDDQDLARALRSLAPKQRAVIVLRYYEDLTEAETARILGVSLGTVKSQHSDAIARLRGMLPTFQTASKEI